MNNKTIKYINLVVLFYLLVSFLSAQEPAKSGEIILKDVNAGSKSIETQINLRDAEKVTGNAKTIVLTSESPVDENTLEEPTKVFPGIENVHFSGTTLTRSLPGFLPTGNIPYNFLNHRKAGRVNPCYRNRYYPGIHPGESSQ
jgi:hypothetical protein